MVLGFEGLVEGLVAQIWMIIKLCRTSSDVLTFYLYIYRVFQYVVKSVSK